MTPQEKQFVNYWSEKRKQWRWKKHSYRTFITVVLPIAILIDLVNYFIIGDTTYDFFSFGHFFVFLLNLIVLSILIILGSGLINWNYNESKYWNILRKSTNKLQ
ncbi:hypothetical protein [Pedobacter sp. UBA4863]|uniref:hypothetical protein n=1 Tax=Pedobacter sp. UBA4863 TaxID=1947060 RepID=UPI0025EE372A|nr:hypothetical protein [Pedobacter sp. UBA4863]